MVVVGEGVDMPIFNLHKLYIFSHVLDVIHMPDELLEYFICGVSISGRRLHSVAYQYASKKGHC